MTPGADVRSIDGLIDWRVAVQNFRKEGEDVLGMISLEVQRAHDYMDDQLTFWKKESRKLEEDVIIAKAELARREMPDFSGRIPDCSVQEEALREAKQRHEFALDQIDTIRKLIVKVPREIRESYESVARRFGNFLEMELTQAISELSKQIMALEAYFALQAETVAPPRTSSELNKE